MKSIKILFFYLSALLLFATSCSEDYLQKVPDGNYTAESYYSSDQALDKVGAPLYNRAWFNYNARAILGMGSLRANDGWNPYLNADFARFQTTALSAEVQNAWSSLYTVVSMSNQIIHDIKAYTSPAITDSAKNKAMGEAYFMRGAAYFYLLRIWGPIILFENNDPVVLVPKIPLSPEKDVLKFIIRDLRQAVLLLPDRMINGRVSKYSAEGMLAKVLLADSGWGVPTRDEGELAECISLCEDVIDNSGASLMPNYDDLYKYQYNGYAPGGPNTNPECLFALHWGDPIANVYGTVNALFSDLAWSEVTDVNAWGNNLQASPDMIDIYNQDIADSIRMKATFFLPNSYYSYIHSQHGGFTYNHTWMQCKKYVVGFKEDCNGLLGQMASPLSTYMLRLADVDLILAEASLGNNSVLSSGRGLDAFNAVRARAKVDPRQQITFEDIIRERRIEFCMEYSNWYDMLTWYRWKPDYMMDYFNNKQNRGYELRDGGIKYNPDGTLRYLVFGWAYLENGQQVLVTNPDDPTKQVGIQVWSDGLRLADNNNTMYKSVASGFVYDMRNYTDYQGNTHDRIVISKSNIFLPYPESDVLQNPYLSEDPQPYDFGANQ